jgi:hypothetical protein
MFILNFFLQQIDVVLHVCREFLIPICITLARLLPEYSRKTGAKGSTCFKLVRVEVVCSDHIEVFVLYLN